MPEAEVPTMEAYQLLLDRMDQLESERQTLINRIAGLQDELSASRGGIEEFLNLTAPGLHQSVDTSAAAVNNIGNSVNVIDAAVAANAVRLEILDEITVPSLQESLTSVSSRILEIPTEFDVTELPTEFDDPDRPLVIGDRSFLQTGTGTVEYRWNGTEWVEAGLELGDILITAAQMKTSRHMFY